MWQRKHRQYEEDRCMSHNELNNYQREEGSEYECWDNGWDDDLRESFCQNKNLMPVADALKSDLECGWSSATTLQLTRSFVFFLVAVIAIAAY